MAISSSLSLVEGNKVYFQLRIEKEKGKKVYIVGGLALYKKIKFVMYVYCHHLLPLFILKKADILHAQVEIK